MKVDVTNIKSSTEFHLLLKEMPGFPHFYGENWDAFYDAITGLVELPMQIQFVGWTCLERNLPYDVKIMKECLNDYNEEFYLAKCEFLSNKQQSRLTKKHIKLIKGVGVIL